MGFRTGRVCVRGHVCTFHAYLVPPSVASLVAQMVKRLPAMRKTEFDPWVRKIPWKRKWQPTPVLLPGKFHGRGSRVGYSPWACKESDMTEHIPFMAIPHFAYGFTK